MHSLLLLLFTHNALSDVIINYQFHEENGHEVNDCIEKSMDILMDETCLFFRQTTDQNAIVTFIQSTHCSWQESNRTVHLHPNCISDDFCYEIIGRVLSVDKPRSHIARHLNLHYNCSDKCTIECKHGGLVQDDCSCKCGYGFSGKRCELLAKEASFSDKSCGVIDVLGDGIVSLSTYPEPRSKTTFCQWLLQSDDPWTYIEVNIERLGLDGEDMRPGSHCNDFFTAFGEEEQVGPIPCDGSRNVTKLRSKTNWLLLELRSDPYSDTEVTGPLLRYGIKRIQPGVRIYSEGMTSSAFVATVPTILLFFMAGTF